VSARCPNSHRSSADPGRRSGTGAAAGGGSTFGADWTGRGGGVSAGRGAGSWRGSGSSRGVRRRCGRWPLSGPPGGVVGGVVTASPRSDNTAGSVDGSTARPGALPGGGCGSAARVVWATEPSGVSGSPRASGFSASPFPPRQSTAAAAGAAAIGIAGSGALSGCGAGGGVVVGWAMRWRTCPVGVVRSIRTGRPTLVAAAAAVAWTAVSRSGCRAVGICWPLKVAEVPSAAMTARRIGKGGTRSTPALVVRKGVTAGSPREIG